MNRPRFTSPNLKVSITPEMYGRAIKSNSGGCLIADAIKSQYPQLTKVSVDMATIRVTDQKRGERYTYLTPVDAQNLLLSFDQGWRDGATELVIRKAVHISPVRRHRTYEERIVQRRREAIARLEKKLAETGKLTKGEKSSLTRMKNLADTIPIPRPANYGKAEVQGAGLKRPVVRGGKRPPMGPNHPNLLRGTDRHFGAKLADPGQAFHNAVDAEVARRLAAEDE